MFDEEICHLKHPERVSFKGNELAFIFVKPMIAICVYIWRILIGRSSLAHESLLEVDGVN